MQQQMQTIVVSLKEWNRINQQVRALREENGQLKRKFMMNSTSFLMKKTSMISSHCNEITESKQEIPKQSGMRQKFKVDMQDWSKKLAAKKLKVNLTPIKQPDDEIGGMGLEQIQAKQVNFDEFTKKFDSENSDGSQKNEEISSPIKNVEIKQEEKQQLSNPLANQLKLIENICLYGPNQEDFKQTFEQGKMHTQVQLIYSAYPSLKQKYIQYGHELYPPEGVPARKLKPEQTAACTNKIIFRKNAKRTDCSLIIFQAEQDNQKLRSKNEILDKANCLKRLTNFYVQFNDFFYFEAQQQKVQGKIMNKSMEEKKGLKQQSANDQQSSRSRKQTKLQKYCVKSSYCLCIFTYFPFINVMQQVVNCLLDEIKIRRVEAYAKQGELQKVSIQYLIKQLNQITKEIMKQVTSIPMHLGEEVTLTLGHFKILFNFVPQKIDFLLYDGWVFDIMKMFSKDTIYEILTNFMTEQSICFVSQNLKLLTDVVFFFMAVLSKPFSYPHTCISRVMKYEFLDSPFIVTLGINQPTKWLEENGKQYYEKKIFVDLNGTQAKICNSKKIKSIKSQKLKKILNNFYKKIQNSSPLPQLFKKKQKIIRPATRQQNQLVVTLIKNIQKYFNQQIFSHLPNHQIVNTLKQSSTEPNQNSKITAVLKQIQKYVKQSRKQSQKDNFIDLLVEQQIFYMYISDLYSLQAK